MEIYLVNRHVAGVTLRTPVRARTPQAAVRKVVGATAHLHDRPFPSAAGALWRQEFKFGLGHGGVEWAKQPGLRIVRYPNGDPQDLFWVFPAVWSDLAHPIEEVLAA